MMWILTFEANINVNMKNLTLIIATLFIASTVFAQRKEESAIRSCFENYKAAILTDNGTAVLSYVDSRTMRYYSDLAIKVRTMDSVKLVNESILDKFSILRIRQTATKEEIRAFDGKGVLAYAINKGMVGKNSVSSNVKMGKVDIEGDFAKGQLVANGEASPFYFHFYKESEKWLFDLTSIFSTGNMALKKMIEESGKDENVFIMELLSMMGGNAGNSIWHAPIVETVK